MQQKRHTRFPQLQTDEMSEELFREIADDLLQPVSLGLDSQTRAQLYISKLIYMEHMRKRAFVSLNWKAETTQFLPSDLELLQEAWCVNQTELKKALLEELNKAIGKAVEKGFYVA
jgi:hypothetical protein